MPPTPHVARSRMAQSATTGTRPELRRPVIALAGNPNCGKTTIFNALTGLRAKVANYPGVTVEKKIGRATLSDGLAVDIIDLPGIYNLGGSSLDEIIASRALFGELQECPSPDLIVVVIDASNLERNLFLASQLLDCDLPLIVALNMCDVAKSQGISIKVELLVRKLGVPVVPVVARKGKGIDLLKEEISRAVKERPTHQGGAWLPCDHPIITIARELAATERGRQSEANDFVIGLSLLSESRSIENPKAMQKLREGQQQLLSAGIDSNAFEATERYRWIAGLVREVAVFEGTASRAIRATIDSILTHRVWGIVIFLLIMGALFQAIFLWASIPMDFIDTGFAMLSATLKTLLPEGILRSLIVDGIVPGVGSVLVFVPQIAVLFFFLGVLEESGYLSRAAFIMDRVLRPFGLQGRSFIPLLSSFACAIPGIMAARTIPSFADRLTTIMVAPFMSCSARLPVYTLLIAAFIPSHTYFGIISLQGTVMLCMYLLGIAGAACVAWIIRRRFLRGEPALFVMEMPPFRRPSVRAVLREVLLRAWLFVRSAGTVILACSIVLWFLASFPRGEVRQSYAGRIGTAIEPALRPLGFNWEIGIGLIASFAAREVFVSSLATVYSIQDDDNATQSLIDTLKSKRAHGEFSLATALSLMVFYVFACQCISTLAICRRETGSWRWPLIMFFSMSLIAYIASLIVYQSALRIL